MYVYTYNLNHKQKIKVPKRTNHMRTPFQPERDIKLLILQR